MTHPHFPAGRPRLGFLGVGWIGRQRLAAIAASGVAEVAAIADLDPALAAEARAHAPGARLVRTLDELLALGLDGVVIATPSALHAAQSLAALDAGCAVFCQKPLGRDAAETRRVVEAARTADRLLAVDLSYRHLAGVQRMREQVRAGELGHVFAAELHFHNAYGPDKAWFYDPQQSGGGCLIDLGIHLVDLALWMLDFPRVVGVSGRLFARGQPLGDRRTTVEDYALARLDLDGGAVVSIACSWNLPAGADARIGATFYGTGGGVRLRNVGGSFYDFVAERLDGTQRHTLAAPPDAWGGRAAVAWARALALDDRFDPAVASLIDVAATLDEIYRTSPS